VSFAKVIIGDYCTILDRSVVEAGAKLENNVLVASVTVISKDTKDTQWKKLIGIPLLRLGLTEDNSMTDSVLLFYEVLTYFLVIYWLILLSIPILSIYNGYIMMFIKISSSSSLLLGFAALVASFPFFIILTCGCLLFMSYVMKSLLIGNFNRFLPPGEVAHMDSFKLFRWQLLNTLILGTIETSLMLINEFWLTSSFWRLMGARIGKNAMIDPDVFIFEADMLKIGDDCRIEDMATLFCHKFSKGLLEMEPITIPNNAYIGSHAVILPGCKISGNHVKVMPLTHVLPREQLSDGVWHGSPAELIDIEYGIA